MSTRSTTHFIYSGESKPTAIIYRHSDGYPQAAGADIVDFLNQCGKLSDSRFSDPSYLAARYVVFLARQFAVTYDFKGKDRQGSADAYREISHADTRPLDFLSVGVVASDPLDIEYRYVVDCNAQGRPTVKVYERDWDAPHSRDKIPEFKLMGELSEVLKQFT